MGCKKVMIFPLEVIVRNVIAGSMAKRVGVAEGKVPTNTIFEICYKIILSKIISECYFNATFIFYNLPQTSKTKDKSTWV